MKIYKNKGIIYSETILSFLNNRLIDNDDLEITVETFYNCREVGYVLRIHDEFYKKSICIWTYANRWSDEPTISYDYINLPKEEANMYDEETWNERTITFKNCEDVVEKIVEIVEEYFKEEVE